MIEGFSFIQGLRLRRQRAADARARAANQFDPRELNEPDRHVLEEAFRQGRTLQQRIALDYRVSQTGGHARIGRMRPGFP